MSVGYLTDGFDLFNIEHLDLIASAAAACDRLIVAVLDDEELAARTGRAPVVPLVERLEIVRHARGVDEVVVHAPGADLSSHLVLVSEDDADGWDVPVVVLPRTRSSASAILRHALRPVVAEAVA